ncbi:MAG: penicillin-binding protein 2 [Alphaproteobacteria bacterium]|nr:penicillin-binding protein 2 [Alphaproteobacteria bacterium]
MGSRVGDILARVPARLTLDGTAKEALETARHRLVVAGALFGLAFAVVGVRLVDVTVLKEAQEPRAPRVAETQRVQMDRADIVDRNGILLATSLSTASLYANPRHVIDPQEAAAKLARTLPGLNEREIHQRLAGERSFVWIRRNLTPKQQDAVNRLGLAGVYFQREERRVYPHGALTGHIVGFTDIDNRGLMGAEQAFDDRLKSRTEPLQLSIDIRAQHILREEVAAAIKEFSAIGGAAMLLDPNSGETYAMVSLPDFDANNPGTAAAEARFNRLTLGIYEPGSAFKTFTAAMALDYNTGNLATPYDATRAISISRFRIDDYKPQRRIMNMSEVFMHSSNIGSVRMAEVVGRERQREFLAKLGLLRAPQFELLEITPPQVPSPWRDINMMTVAFGHGISVSPLALTASTAAIVNGGMYRNPTIVKRAEGEQSVGERVIAGRTSEQMRRLMRLVVEKGTAKSANVPGYLVGGKTGTPEKIENGRYKKDTRISSFVGAFPMNSPKFVVYMMLDEPKGNKSTFGYATAGWVVAPSIQRIVQRIAALYGIEPVDEMAPMVRDQMLINVAVR